MISLLWRRCLLAGLIPWTLCRSGLVEARTRTLADDDYEDFGRGKRVGLLTQSYPWTFGPYQSQMYLLSLALHHDHGLDVMWIPAIPGSSVPVGEYKTFENLVKSNPSIRVAPPPDDFALDHITFLGSIIQGEWSLDGHKNVAASHINRLGKRYDLDAVIMLRDAVTILPDMEFTIPVIGWIPIHSHGPIRNGIFEHWVLRHFHGFAALSPSSLRDVREGLSDDKRGHTITLTHIPHIIEPSNLQERARKARQRLAGALYGTHDNGGTEVCHTKGDCTESEEDARRFQREATLRSFMRSRAAGDETFIVHAKGGNYDQQDRKGWDAAVQAFAGLFKRVKESGSEGPPVHLYVHSIESQLIASDSNNNEEAPPSVLPVGINLRLRLYHTDIPETAYTLDGTIHDLDVVAGLQEMASVCLLPSRVEGFGMNIVECQAVGTPVVTMNHTATGDYTRLGRSVPVRQYHFAIGIPYEIAQPDVPSLVDALWDLYTEHATMLREKAAHKGHNIGPVSSRRQEQVRETEEWITTGFSQSYVGQQMYLLLGSAAHNCRVRNEWLKTQAARSKQELIPVTYTIEQDTNIEVRDRPPNVEWMILAPPGITFDDRALRYFAWTSSYEQQNPSLFFIPLPGISLDSAAKAVQSGQEIPLPMMVRSHFVLVLQGQTTNKKSLMHLILKNSQRIMAIKRLPDGIARFTDDTRFTDEL
jgi:glycosyltransferase involved in cell wall biosynthesis